MQQVLKIGALIMLVAMTGWANAQTLDGEAIREMTISPNPVVNSFQLSFESEGNSEVNVKVFDVTGKVIYNHNYNDVNGNYSKKFSVSELNLVPGMYLVRVRRGNEHVTKKMIVKA